MKIYFNSRIVRYLCPNWVQAIALPWGLHVRGKTVSERLVAHEKTHYQQMETDGLAWFYVKYLAFWLVNMVKYRLNWKKAYLNVPYEIEARKAESVV